MIIEKPLWVQHKTENGKLATIYSVDVHPDGTRIVTGAGDSIARIWSMKPITDKNAEKNNVDFPKQLAVCQGGHTRAITCVRWSSNGVFLACGSDDTNVTVWMKQKTQVSQPVVESDGTTVTTDAGANAENKGNPQQNGAEDHRTNGVGKQCIIKEEWTRLLTCMGHASDVQDLAWAPDDSKLASCSVDNTIHVWAINNSTIGLFVLHQPLAKLSGHEGWVKGLAWDPVGKYLASIGSDNVMNVWRTSDWKCEGKVSEPFKSGKRSSGNVVRRISWSPDGRHVCGTLAFKNSAHCAVIIDRNTWKDGCELVGHTVGVVASRFNSRVFLKQSKRTKKPKKIARKNLKNNTVSCCAIGDLDGTISIWTTAAEAPIVVLKKALGSAITDLAWSIKDGKTLVASSLSGRILVVRFEDNELGSILSLEDHAYLLRQLYGDTNASFEESQLVENTIQLGFEGSSDSQGSNKPSFGQSRFGFAGGSASSISPDQPTMTLAEATAYMEKEGGKMNSTSTEGIILRSFKTTNSPVRKKQRESTKNGKKRIRPVLITRPLGNNNSTDGNSSLGASDTGKVTTITELMKKVSSKPNRSKGVIGGDGDEGDETEGGKKANTPSSSSKGQNQFAVPSRKRNRSLMSGSSKRSKASKPNSSESITNKHQSQEESAMRGGNNNGMANGIVGVVKNIYQLDLPSRRPTHSTVIGHRFIETTSSNMMSNGHKQTNAQSVHDAGRTKRSKILSLGFRIVTPGESVSIATSNASSSTTNTLPSNNGALPVGGMNGTTETKNTHSSKHEDRGVEFDCLATTILTLSCGGAVCWRDQIRGRGSLLAGNDNLACISTTSGELLMYTMAGRRKCAPVILPTPLAFLECVSSNDAQHGKHGGNAVGMNNSSNFIMGITCDGEMRIWDAASVRLLVHDRNGIGRLLHMVASQLKSKLVHIAAEEKGQMPTNMNEFAVSAKLNNVSLLYGMNRPTPVVTIVASALKKTETRLARVFAYNYSMQSWTSVGSDSFVRSNFFNTLSFGGVTDGIGTLNSLQTACVGISNYEILEAAAGTSGDGILTLDTQWIETRAHLEHQLACALLIESPSEYKSWLNAYAKFLASSGSIEAIDRLKELCNELVGPAIPFDGWKSDILGLSRRSLLQGVLREMASNRGLQRLVQEYTEAI